MPKEAKGKGKKGEGGHVHITLRAEDALMPGDVLLAGEEVLGMVADVVPTARMPKDRPGDPADLVVPRDVARRLAIPEGRATLVEIGRAEGSAGSRLAVRRTGDYSLITLQPLRRAMPGQSVNQAQVRWLHSRGLDGILAELTAQKSDDLTSRSRLIDMAAGKLDRATPIPPGAPETLFALQAWLLALGLDVKLATAGSCVSVGVRPATSAELIARSR